MDHNKFHVTLSALRKAGACVAGYNRLVRALQGCGFTKADNARGAYIRFPHKDPVSLRFVLDSNGLDDALWALRCIDGADNDKDVRLFVVWCVRQVEHLMTDARSIDALDVDELYANNQATDGAAGAAARISSLGEPASAWGAARSAARSAAWASANSGLAWNSAWLAARDAQKTRLSEMLEAGRF